MKLDLECRISYNSLFTMKQQISLRQANQHLSRYVKAVERGHEFVITRRGKPVAVIAPPPLVSPRKLSRTQREALKRLFSGARPLRIRRWRREELYEDV